MKLLGIGYLQIKTLEGVGIDHEQIINVEEIGTNDGKEKNYLLCKGWNVLDGQITSMGPFSTCFGVKVMCSIEINLGCKDACSN